MTALAQLVGAEATIDVSVWRDLTPEEAELLPENGESVEVSA